MHRAPKTLCDHIQIMFYRYRYFTDKEMERKESCTTVIRHVLCRTPNKIKKGNKILPGDTSEYVEQTGQS